jgi:serine/threonine protein kinase
LEGTILSNRYEIIEKIGSGGMAVVYKGKDLLLNRVVAVKILRDQFAQDEGFVQRFRREAQSAASLSHPNIVSIYDVGQQDDTYFLVMEYVVGSSLKKLIKQKGPMAPEEVIEIAFQLCEALEHAHQHGIIHRDIKPHNILVTADGSRVKVTDFGIARAVTTATVTYPKNMLGSVHYISPEQARGETAGEKTDIYAVGVVLYEMLTGSLPFNGDTPITVALKHVQDKPESLRELNPEVPAGLEQITLRAMAKDPEARYPNARAIRMDLTRFYQEYTEDESPTQVLPVVNQTEVKGETKSKPLPPGKKSRFLTGALLLLLIMAVATLGLYWGWQSYWIISETSVPLVTEKSLVEAEQMLREAGLVPRIGTQINHPTVAAGNVIKQSIPAGETVRKGREVFLDLSLGPSLAKIPDIVGKKMREAQIIIDKEGFVLATSIQEVFHDSIPAGLIIDQEPKAYTSQPRGTVVRVTVSKGKEPVPVTMPNLVGKSLEEAQAELERLGLQSGVVSNQQSNDYLAGKVVDQDVKAGNTALRGTAINLVVSQGPGPVAQTAIVDNVRIPDDGKEHEVRIAVADTQGTHEEYKKTHKSGEIVNTTVKFYGRGAVQIYLDDALIYQQPVP